MIFRLGEILYFPPRVPLLEKPMGELVACYGPKVDEMLRVSGPRAVVPDRTFLASPLPIAPRWEATSFESLRLYETGFFKGASGCKTHRVSISYKQWETLSRGHETVGFSGPCPQVRLSKISVDAFWFLKVSTSGPLNRMNF